VIQDGRTYVAFSDSKYDLITSDPIHPWVKGAANLYTQEYYERASRHLTPGGIFCQWIPSTMSVAAFHSILKTIHSAFPHVEFLFADREVVAVAALQPIVYDEAKLRERMAAPSVSRDLEQLRLDDVDKMMRLLDDNLHPIQRTRFQEARLNTDDNVFLEHQLPWDTFHGHVVQLRPKATAAAKRSPRAATYVRPVTTRSMSPVQRSSAAVPSATVPSAAVPPTPRAR
jgi:spermidine synthase